MKELITKKYHQTPIEAAKTVGLVTVPGAPLVILGSLFTGTFTLAILTFIVIATGYVGVSIYSRSLASEATTSNDEESAEQPDSEKSAG